MRKTFAVMIVILFICSCLLSGCSENNNERVIINESKPLISTSQAPEDTSYESDEVEIIIYYPTFIQGLIDGSGDDCLPKEIEEEWEEKISELGGRSVDIRFVSFNMTPNTMTSLEPGLIYVRNSAQLYPLMEADLILPLNEYNMTVGGFDALDFEALMSYTDENGYRWGVPSSNSAILEARWYDEEWLKSLEFEIPTSIYELESLGQLVKNNPRSTKKSYLFGIDNQVYLYSDVNDIFRAFGCFPESISDNIAFDSIRGIYYDNVFTDGFKEAVEFMAHLITEGLVLYETELSFDEMSTNYDFMTGLFREPARDATFGYYLFGPNSEKIISIIQASEGFVVLRGTPDVSSKLDYLVNSLFTNEELVRTLRYGVEGYHYSYKDGIYTMLRNENGKFLWNTRIVANITIKQNMRNDYLDGKISNPATLKSYKAYDKMREITDANKGNIHFQNPFNKAVPFALPDEFLNSDFEKQIDQVVLFNYRQLLHEVYSQQKSVEDAVLDYGYRLEGTQYEEYFEWLNTP